MTTWKSKTHSGKVTKEHPVSADTVIKVYFTISCNNKSQLFEQKVQKTIK